MHAFSGATWPTVPFQSVAFSGPRSATPFQEGELRASSRLILRFVLDNTRVKFGDAEVKEHINDAIHWSLCLANLAPLKEIHALRGGGAGVAWLGHICR